MEYITKLFITFITYSFLGWCVEEFYALVITKTKTNRGFLVGPLCPVYGFTSVALILLLDNFKDNLIVLFILSIVIAAFIEYLASYILEKFLSIKLWDYSKDSKYNVKGRIALYTLIPFGILGTIVIKYINPLIQSLINKVSLNMLYYTSIVIIVLLLIDIIFSVFIIKRTQGTGDITDEKNKEVKKHIKKTTKVVQQQLENTTKIAINSIKTTNENVKKIIKK
jgi:uncharacterized membrane protein